MTARDITTDDIWSAARGLRMFAQTPEALDAIIAAHQPIRLFTSRVIVRAALQVKDAKAMMARGAVA